MPFSFSLAATRLTRMESDVVRVCCCRCRVQCAVQEKQTLENNGCVCEDETRELQYYQHNTTTVLLTTVPHEQLQVP